MYTVYISVQKEHKHKCNNQHGVYFIFKIDAPIFINQKITLLR